MYLQEWWTVPSSKAAGVLYNGKERSLCLGECFPISWHPDPTRAVTHVLICETQANMGANVEHQED